jgi:hypothetical protein
LLNRLIFQLSNFIVYTQEGNFNERNNENSISLDFKNSANVSIGYNNYDVQLLYPTKFVSDAAASPLQDKRYKYHKYAIKGATDNRKSFSVAGSIQWGTFYSGRIQEYGLLLNVRKQPKLNLGIDMQYNRIQFPTAYGKAEFILIAPNVEYNFSTKLFWTTFLQYNSQNNNFNINSRIQWRYRPMSDLFVVYTDNYFTDPLLKNKNRALVFKLNYWMNM